MFFPPDTPWAKEQRSSSQHHFGTKNPTPTKIHVTHTACIDLCLANRCGDRPSPTPLTMMSTPIHPKQKQRKKCTNHTTCHRLFPSVWRYPSPNLQITMKKTYIWSQPWFFWGNSLVSRSSSCPPCRIHPSPGHPTWAAPDLMHAEEAAESQAEDHENSQETGQAHLRAKCGWQGLKWVIFGGSLKFIPIPLIPVPSWVVLNQTLTGWGSPAEKPSIRRSDKPWTTHHFLSDLRSPATMHLLRRLRSKASKFSRRKKWDEYNSSNMQ